MKNEQQPENTSLGLILGFHGQATNSIINSFFYSFIHLCKICGGDHVLNCRKWILPISTVSVDGNTSANNNYYIVSVILFFLYIHLFTTTKSSWVVYSSANCSQCLAMFYQPPSESVPYVVALQNRKTVYSFTESKDSLMQQVCYSSFCTSDWYIITLLISGVDIWPSSIQRVVYTSSCTSGVVI